MKQMKLKKMPRKLMKEKFISPNSLFQSSLVKGKMDSIPFINNSYSLLTVLC